MQLTFKWVRAMSRSPTALNSVETLASDALERLATMLGIALVLDDPEPALISAVERAVGSLIARLRVYELRDTVRSPLVAPIRDPPSDS